MFFLVHKNVFKQTWFALSKSLEIILIFLSLKFSPTTPVPEKISQNDLIFQHFLEIISSINPSNLYLLPKYLRFCNSKKTFLLACIGRRYFL